MKLRISIFDIITVLLYLAVFKIYAIPQALQQALKIGSILLVLIYLVAHIHSTRLFNGGFAIAAFFSLSSVISLLSHIVETKAFLDGILNGLCVYCIYTTIQYAASKGRLEHMLRLMTRVTMLYCLISLVSIYRTGTSSSGTEMTYFFGNKFSTSYFFLMLSALYYVSHHQHIRRHRKEGRIYFVIVLISAGVCLWTQCSTALIGSAFLLVGPFLPDGVKRFVMRPQVVLAAMIISGIITLGIDIFLSNDRVAYFVTQVLNKSVGLTGRVHIYEQLPTIIARRPFFGYGYNSFIVTQVAGYGNAQNGLMEYLVNYGFVGTIVFLLVVWQCVGKTRLNLNAFGFMLIIYALIICSVAEITYNYYFMIALFSMQWIRQPVDQPVEAQPVRRGRRKGLRAGRGVASGLTRTNG